MFNNYGTVQKFGLDYDASAALEERKQEAKSPTKVKEPTTPLKVDDGEGDGDKDPSSPAKKEDDEPPPEVPFDATVYYDFKPYNGQEPILLSLMIKRGDKTI